MAMPTAQAKQAQDQGKSGSAYTSNAVAGKPTPSGGIPGTPPSIADLFSVLTDILTTLQMEYNAGAVDVQIDYLPVTTAANTVAPLYVSQKRVRGGLFENLSTTDTITFAIGQPGKVATIIAGQGIVLNPASISGYGGGTWAFFNIDLSRVTAVTQTNTGQYISAVYYY